MADRALACAAEGPETRRSGCRPFMGKRSRAISGKIFSPGAMGPVPPAAHSLSAGRDFFHMKGKTLKMGPRFTSGERMKSRILCKKKRAQSRSISGRRCSLDWEQDFTQMGGLDPGKGDAGSHGPPIVLFKKCLETPIRKSERGNCIGRGLGLP